MKSMAENVVRSMAEVYQEHGRECGKSMSGNVARSWQEYDKSIAEVWQEHGKSVAGIVAGRMAGAWQKHCRSIGSVWQGAWLGTRQDYTKSVAGNMEKVWPGV